jgi:hypothetical protein
LTVKSSSKSQQNCIAATFQDILLWLSLFFHFRQKYLFSTSIFFLLHEMSSHIVFKKIAEKSKNLFCFLSDKINNFSWQFIVRRILAAKKEKAFFLRFFSQTAKSW